ncbi:peptidoglycan DD-metalloendopeptidase family protein [Flavobacterium sp. 3HN19-14]|uniref:peptidoglycan DD-metalloendopeptidase family protein n=1 Tax=Flavobacterium sp. 3HN19-14 TaxID=3448133 RepID=UPI003EE3578D
MTDFGSLVQNIGNVKVIDDNISYRDYIYMDLSASNPVLSALDFNQSVSFEAFVENYLETKNAKVAYGGYIEKRDLYKRSSIFNKDSAEERNIHIAIDLWTKAGTSVLAALDGTVHSFQFNKALGDYGPTIILEHQIENTVFYTLYGHLSVESIENLQTGQAFLKGNSIGTLGDAAVNGDYAPHLHFQIIRNIGDKFGDYPGVCSKSDLPFFLENCPDPNLLLKIKT